MSHPRNAGYEPGNHWLVCDRCGRDIRVDGAKKEWNGLWVCKDRCYEPRHPQDFVRGIREDTAAKEPVRPKPDDVFADNNFGSQQISVPSGTFDNEL